MAIFLCKGACMSFLYSFFKKHEENTEEKNTENKSTVNEIIIEDDEDEIAAVIAAALASMEDDEETVAAITAAIAVMLGSRTDEFIVRNIKRTPDMDPIWAVAGRMKLMR
jgi:Na+-transporting methylmalonyl-CoA/oxaloacetate decarboxylase gamma subunit